MSTRYLQSGDDTIKENIGLCSGRFGATRLEETLRSWRVLYEEFRNDIFPGIRVDEMSLVQESFVNSAVNHHRSGNLPGIGPWLLYAPFKMLLLDRDDVYKDSAIVYF